MQKMVKVWDLPTRLFHWTLAVLFVFLIISGDLGGDLTRWHFYAGYLLSGLIVFRLLWGLGGTTYARFSSFLFNPKRTACYAVSVLKGQPTHYYGHNPAGAVMVIALLLLLLLQVLSGLVTTDDILWSGPFYSKVSDEVAEWGGEIHEIGQAVLQLLVVLHIAAVVFHRVRFRDPLVPAMLHGNKPDLGGATARDSVRIVPLLLSILCAAGWVVYLFSLPL